MSIRRGVLLLNLGTPAAPEAGAVRRYLREFLGDPRVLDVSPAARRLILELFILPFRPRRSAAAYAQIWTREGSPLLLHTRALRDAVAERLGPHYAVEVGMRYGAPSIASALERLRASRPRGLVVLPLFPQYSAAATGSALARVHTLLARSWDVPSVSTVGAFFARPGFIEATAHVARPLLADFRADHVLFSYHGLPERQIRKSDPLGGHCLASGDCCASAAAAEGGCYRAQCFATSAALRDALGLAGERCSTAFQSRLGRTPWIRPYTDAALPELAERGVKRIAVLCPSFVADCLETLEEIGIRGREQWREVGGDELLLVPCVNAHPVWADAVANLVREHAGEDAGGGHRPRP
jgi:ferrochelatase